MSRHNPHDWPKHSRCFAMDAASYGCSGRVALGGDTSLDRRCHLLAFTGRCHPVPCRTDCDKEASSSPLGRSRGNKPASPAGVAAYVELTSQHIQLRNGDSRHFSSHWSHFSLPAHLCGQGFLHAHHASDHRPAWCFLHGLRFVSKPPLANPSLDHHLRHGCQHRHARPCPAAYGCPGDILECL